MAIHWDIPFKSLRSARTYWVSVYDNSYGSNTPVELKGGVVPFETQEDTDDDWFKPVRTQSGYLRIMDDGNDLSGYPLSSGDKWTDMIPSDDKNRKVILTSGGVTYWRGYLQPQTFSGILYENAQERQFPVACPLSVLEGVDVDTTARGVVTFAYLLGYILEATGYSWPYIYFQGSDSLDWLRKKVDWENFIETDEDGTRRSKYNCLDLLNELCKFWGWTCRTYGESIYFLSPDDHFYPYLIRITEQDLWTLNSGSTPQYSTPTWGGADTDNDIYASTDNIIEYLRGIRKATVSANINKQSAIIKFPSDVVERQIRKLYPTAQTRTAYDNIFIECDTITSSTVTKGCVIQGTRQADSDGHNYKWTYYLFLTGPGEASSPSNIYAPLVDIYLRYRSNIDHSMIVISGDILDENFATLGASGYLYCTLHIGDYWWNGTAWTTTAAIFTIPIGDGKGINCNRDLDADYDSFTGFGIEVGNAIGGIMHFCILGKTLVNDLRITSLSIDLLRKLSYANNSERSTNIYEEETGTVFNGSAEVSTIIASDNGNATGIGIIMNQDGSYCSGVHYSYSAGSETKHPEQHLVERMAERGASVKLKETIEVRSNLINITPITDCETFHMSGYPIAISHNWCDDIAKVIILEY